MTLQETLLQAEMTRACVDHNYYETEFEGFEFNWSYEDIDGEQVARVYARIYGQLETEFIGWARNETRVRKLILDFVNGLL